MEKFSLFDILSILLPGVFMLFISKILVDLFVIIPQDIKDIMSSKISDFGISLFFSLIFGGFTFFISDKLKNSFLFKNILRIYKPIGKIFYSINKTESTFFETLNVKSQLWFNEQIFISKQDFNKLNANERQHFINIHDRFYPKAYYDLQYNGKIDYPKVYQSFYYFFRQVITGLIILLPVIITALIVQYDVVVLGILIFCTSIFLMAIALARYFRSEMVKKLYIIYSIHLQNN